MQVDGIFPVEQKRLGQNRHRSGGIDTGADDGDVNDTTTAIILELEVENQVENPV